MAYRDRPADEYAVPERRGPVRRLVGGIASFIGWSVVLLAAFVVILIVVLLVLL